ncbi:MAG: MBL fold metallo-hydrolase [Clostridia bacterium]|nr:MBL fold metallo-hydrolase [Clostridia bacterium]
MLIHVLMENSALCEQFAAEHGLSLYIEANGRRILFDAGQTDAFAENAARLGVDLARVDLCILSHGHYDHSGGLMRFLEINDHAPIYMHRHAVQPHYNGTVKYIGIDEKLIDHPRIVYTDDELALGYGLQLCTCNALAGGCPASARGMTVRSVGGFLQDSFDHEQYLIIEEEGKQVVISGCSHKGILDIVKWLQPDVLIGGFHFVKLDPEGEDRAFMEAAAQQLLEHDCVYYTGHCTGEAAFAFLKQRMGDRLHPIPAGTRIELLSE